MGRPDCIFKLDSARKKMKKKNPASDFYPSNYQNLLATVQTQILAQTTLHWRNNTNNGKSRVFLKRRPKNEDLRPKTPWTKTKTSWTKTKTPWTKTKTP